MESSAERDRTLRRERLWGGALVFAGICCELAIFLRAQLTAAELRAAGQQRTTDPLIMPLMICSLLMVASGVHKFVWTARGTQSTYSQGARQAISAAMAIGILMLFSLLAGVIARIAR